MYYVRYFNNSNKLLYIIEGGVKDVVDHYMSMFACPLSLYLKTKKINKKNIYIISGDHSGFCTKSCLEKCFEFNEIKNISIKNVFIIFYKNSTTSNCIILFLIFLQRVEVLNHIK